MIAVMRIVALPDRSRPSATKMDTISASWALVKSASKVSTVDESVAFLIAVSFAE